MLVARQIECKNGRFGACLMAEPQLVADCIAAMREVVDIPVTVKTRIGIDEQDSYEFLTDFVSIVSKKVAVSSLPFMRAKLGYLD